MQIYYSIFDLLSTSLLRSSNPQPERHILNTVLSCRTVRSTILPYCHYYGLQRDSILNSSHYFHVTEGLPMDIRHDILEGSLQYEVKELLKHLIFTRMITLVEVNNAIESFPYGYSDILDNLLQLHQLLWFRQTTI